MIDEAEEFRAYPKSVQPGIPTLGDVPEGWRVLPMGKLLKVVQRPVKMVDDDVYQLVTARRNRGGLVARERLTGAKIATKTQFRVNAGDFVMSRRQIAHGACGILPNELDDALVSNEYAALLPTDKLDAGFLRHLPHSVYFQQTCFHSSIGVHVEKLVFNLNHWLERPFLIPPVSEQKGIATILDVWDVAIDLAERIYRNQQSLIDAMSSDLLTGRRRLPGFKVPLGERKLSDYFSRRQQSGEPNLPLLSVTLDRGIVFRDTIERRSESALVEEAHSLVEPGDIAYNMMRMWQGASGLCTVRGNISPAYVVMTPHENIDPAFAAQWLKSKGAIEILRSHSHGLTKDRLRLYPDDFLSISAKIPPLDEQRRIADFLDGLVRTQRDGVALFDNLKKQKRGLMQQLLTGKIRVPKSINALFPPLPELVAAA